MEFSHPWAMGNGYWMQPVTAPPASADGPIQFGSFPGLQHMDVPSPGYAGPQPGMGVGYGVAGQMPPPYYQPQQATHPPRPGGARRGSGGSKRPQPPGPPASGAPYSGQMTGPPQGPGAYYPYGGMPYQPVGFVEQQQWPPWGGDRASSRMPLEASPQGPPVPRAASSVASEPEQSWSPQQPAANRAKKALSLVDPKTNKAITGDKGETAPLGKSVSSKDVVRKSKLSAPEKSAGQKLARSQSGEVKVLHSAKHATVRGGLMSPHQQGGPSPKAAQLTTRGEGSSSTSSAVLASTLHKPTAGTQPTRLVAAEHKFEQPGLQKGTVPEGGKAAKKGKPQVVAVPQGGSAKSVVASDQRTEQQPLPAKVDKTQQEGSAQRDQPPSAEKMPTTESDDAKPALAKGAKSIPVVENGVHTGKVGESHVQTDALPKKTERENVQEESHSRSDAVLKKAERDEPVKEEPETGKSKWSASKKGWSAIQPKPAPKAVQPSGAPQAQQTPEARLAQQTAQAQQAAEAAKAALEPKAPQKEEAPGAAQPQQVPQAAQVSATPADGVDGTDGPSTAAEGEDEKAWHPAAAAPCAEGSTDTAPAPTAADAVVIPSSRVVAEEEDAEPIAASDTPAPVEGKEAAASGGVPSEQSEAAATTAEAGSGVASPVVLEPPTGTATPNEVAPATGTVTPASPEESEPSSSGAGEAKSNDENMWSPAPQTSRRYYSMESLNVLRAANSRPPDGFEKGPWSPGEEGFLPPRRSGSLKTVTRSPSFSSNSGDQSKRDWRGLGPSRSRSGLRIGDAEIDHKRSGKRVYVFDFLLKVKSCFMEKPLDIAVGQFLKDAIAPTRSGRNSDRWGSRGARGSVEDRDRERDRERERERERDRDRSSRSSGGMWGKDPSQGRTGSGRSYRSRAGVDRGKGIDEDRWGKAPMPLSPFGAASTQLHKSENRYVVGKTTSDDPEEEKRQKSFKSILNKLTPDNFQKMFNLMKEVEIASAQTLTGLIDQIFDKALIETTFCALYASLCKLLSMAMPEFTVEGDPRKVTFRRLLLNKCQAEFEKGDAAMRAAEEAESKGAGTEEDRKILIQAKKERMRSLGNMQFIGHLFKEGMLTEKIIHQCIVELLREEKSPKPEDIECLCKLVATVGRRLTLRSELKAYFVRVGRLAENQNLDVRHRFMLLDLIEMKDRGWVERRQQEGPKTIEEIHKEAAKEQMAIRDRGRGGGGGHWGGSRSARHLEDRVGGGMWGRSGPPPPPGRPGPSPSPTPPLMRGEEVRPLTRIRSLGRTDSQEISLRPAGRQQQRESPSFVRRPNSPSKEPMRERPVLNLAPPSRKPVPQAEEPPKAISEELLKRKVKGLIEEYYHDMDNIDEPVKCVEELKTAGAQVPEILSTSVEQALNIRGIDAAKRLLPLADLMIALSQGQPDDAAPVASPEDMEKGVEGILQKIPDMAEDFPNAPKLIGRLLGILVSQDIVGLHRLGSMILAGGGPDEDSPLVDSACGSKVILEILKEVKEGKESEGLKCVKDWLNSESVNIIDYYASYERDTIKPEDVLSFLDD